MCVRDFNNASLGESCERESGAERFTTEEGRCERMVNTMVLVNRIRSGKNESWIA